MKADAGNHPTLGGSMGMNSPHPDKRKPDYISARISPTLASNGSLGPEPNWILGLLPRSNFVAATSLNPSLRVFHRTSFPEQHDWTWFLH